MLSAIKPMLQGMSNTVEPELQQPSGSPNIHIKVHILFARAPSALTKKAKTDYDSREPLALP